MGNSISCLEINLENLNYKSENIFTHDTTMEIWFLNSDFDSDGNLYVFWNKVGNGLHTLRSVKKGGEWSSPDTIIFVRRFNGVRIPDSFLLVYYDLAIDNSGKFHLVGLDMGGFAYAFSIDSGRTWIGYRNLSYVTSVPKLFEFRQNYPNPFNLKTTIEFSIYKEAYFSLKIYNIEGRIITTLVSSNKKPGTYKIEFNASDLSSGVYFAELTVDRQKEIQKMLLIK